MADYKGIQGYSVQKLSSDPTASSDTEGQLFYNSGTGKFKVVQEGAGAWSSGGAMNNTHSTTGGMGTQTAALVATGSYPATATSEEYNGSSWTEGNDVNNAMYGRAGCGTQTAGLLVLGSPPNYSALCEEYDGTSWTEVNAANNGGGAAGSCGTQTAAVLSDRSQDPGIQAFNEEYDGTTWTETGGNLNSARHRYSTAGTQTAGLAAGGELASGTPDTTVVCEEYDGSTWTEVGDIPTATDNANVGPVGIQTAALMFGGQDGPGAGTDNHTATFSYDGTSWSTVGSLATGRNQLSGLGTQIAALAAGGKVGSTDQTVTEEFISPVYTVKTVTVS